MALKPVNQQVVVVTGATSGIGRATALLFAERGAKVVLSGRNLPALITLVGEIRDQGGEVVAVQADVSDFEQVKSIADRAISEYGRIDTWINMAAVSIYAPFEEITPEEFRRVIDVNLMGQVYGAKAALPYLRREGRGALINISSIEARRAMPLHSPYTASKHAILGFLDALRMEVEHEGLPISVTNVMPAAINTPFFDKALTKLGVKPRPIPPVYEPEVVAKTILYAAEHPVREIYAGGAGKGFGLLQRLSPRLAEKMLLPVAFDGQKTDEPKTADDPNNLFRHAEGYDTVQGSFSHEARQFSLYTWMSTNPAVKYGLIVSALAAGTLLSGRALKAGRPSGFSLPKLRKRSFKV